MGCLFCSLRFTALQSVMQFTMSIVPRASTSLQKVLKNNQILRMMSSEPSGGRSEGAVREAGGNFSKKQKAEEDQYFRRQQQEQLKKMKEAEAQTAKQSGKK